MINPPVGAAVVSYPLPKLPPPLTLNFDPGAVVPMPTLPLPCWTTNCESPTVNPCPDAIVVVPVVPVMARDPVVVAPPEMVSPVACPPAPMVELAVERMPLVNERRVEVAFEGDG